MSPADAARGADVAITMVADPAALQAVTGRDRRNRGRCGQTTTVIQMSTVGPAAISRLAAALPAGRLLDAPVLGSLAEAEAGEPGSSSAGPTRLVEEWTPPLSVLGSLLHVGPLGAGSAAKLVANTTRDARGTRRGARARRRARARPQHRIRDPRLDAAGGQAERRRPALESGEYPPDTLALARKDADLVAEAAARAGLDLGLAEAARSWLREAEEAGLEADYSAMLARILSR